MSVETLSDLGAPAIAGAVVGALIAHYSAKARGAEEHERALDLLVTQDERSAARGALDAIREIKNRLSAGEVTSFGGLHNEWNDRVLAPARLIRNDDLEARVRAGLYVVFLGTLLDEYVLYAMLRAALDVEAFLEAWLRREEPPAAHLPIMDEIQTLVRSVPGKQLSIDPLTDLLQSRA